jgi:2-polyprenyl-6-hydroxyphenyl methylase/3-demethylubiquinone-9 3-methyltransferase
VRYRRCRARGFLFTDAFDRWSQDDFKTHIYNEGYAAVDLKYAEARPRNNATAVLALFGADKAGGACSITAAATTRSAHTCGRPDFRLP